VDIVRKHKKTSAGSRSRSKLGGELLTVAKVRI
jgi:hypothetical protein